ncbi:DUF2953 domain-containing protein [Intestinibacillus massiliensis]|nr:DUF2953 domain-containing protein [Intestinibacillus massiliensis]
MIVLKTIGLILLSLLLLLCALGLFLLLARARVDFRGKDGDLSIRVGLGPFHFKIWPLPKALRGRAEKAGGHAPTKGKPKAEKGAEGKFHLEKLGLGDVLCLVLDLLSQMREKLILETVFADVVIGTGDAARTGILYGYSAAGAGMLLPFLEQNFRMGKCHIAVDADFDAAVTHWNVKLVFAVRPGSLLAVLLHNRKRLMDLYRLITKEEGAKTV